jgi:hypothetical protein
MFLETADFHVERTARVETLADVRSITVRVNGYNRLQLLPPPSV